MILVTGSSGYIGDKVFLALQEKGFEVMGCDLKDGGDYGDTSLDGVKILVHLGAFINLPDSYKHPHAYYENNVAKMLPLLQRAKEKNVRVVYASSIANTHSPYGMSKRIGEKLLKDYQLKHTILRLHNVCGRGGRGVVDLVMNPALQTFDQYSDSERDYIHVDDVTRSIVLAATSPLPLRIYEVGTGELTKTSELVALARKVRHFSMRHNPPRIGDVKTVEHEHGLLMPKEFLLYPTIKDIVRSMV